MFNYLMPLLVMPTTTTHCSIRPIGLRWKTDRVCPTAQRGWGMSVGLSRWTCISVSIRAFGVPGLGLKRGLAEDVVIAPYARWR
jgi:hypothetical protein